MKHISYLFALIFFFTSCSMNNIEDQITFKQVDPYLKIFRESNFLPAFDTTPEVAAGECATFQFAIRAALPLNDLNIEVSEFRSDNNETFGDIQTGFIDYVKVGRQTPDRAKDALNSLSLYYPDPIIETQAWKVERDVTQPMWVTVNIPRTAKAGDYTATFTLKGKLVDQSFTLKKDIHIKVYPIVLNEPDLWVTNWFSTSDENMKIFNGGKEVETYSDTYWKLIQELAEKMKVCFSNVIIVSPFEHIDIKKSENTYTFDFTNFDKMVTIFHQAGVLKMIEGGHIAARCGDWGSQFEVFLPTVEKGEKKNIQKPISDAEAQNFYKQFIPALYTHIKQKFPEVQYAQHIADEPIDCNVKTYVEIARYVKNLCPDIKIIEACHSNKLENTVDIWVPQLNFYNENFSFYKEREAAGDMVWFYTCLAPQGQFANRFIEQPLIKPRLIHWLNFKYDCKGYLHWGFNQWTVTEEKDPFDETTVMNKEGGNTLPGGDSWIVYPKNGKLHGSIRLEAMRDGINDYTLLRMFEAKNPELAKELARQVVYRWDHYDTEANHFRTIRHQILEELSK